MVLEDAAFDEDGNPLPRVVVMAEPTGAVPAGGKDSGVDRGLDASAVAARVREVANVHFAEVVLKKKNYFPRRAQSDCRVFLSGRLYCRDELRSNEPSSPRRKSSRLRFFNENRPNMLWATSF